MAQVYPGVDADLAHSRPVKAAVRVTADPIAARAKANLAGHRETGSTRIETKRQDTDVLIIMSDKHGAASAIEYGGIRKEGRDEPQVIQGLFILTKAAGL